jgi:dephospho-CoA kinase
MMNLKKKYRKLKSEDRLYQLEKPVLGLTGGIATGKSSVSKILRAKGLEIIDADQLVKSIYLTDEAKAFVRDHFADAWIKNEINFPKLRELVFKDPSIKVKVENFIYQRLPAAFLEASFKIKNQSFLIYDVPLLFEKGLNTKVDLSVVVYAPMKIQIPRIMDRDGHEQELAKKILEQQMDIEEKKLKADFVIDNSRTMTELAAEVDQLLLQLLD